LGVSKTTTSALRLLVLLLVALPPSPARAYFDIVSLYQQKVKAFEAVYYLESDQKWQRDRRVFEVFYAGDRFLSAEQDGQVVKEGYTNQSAGMLVNVRPGDGDLQLGLFNLWSSNRLDSSSSGTWEALHGGRVTFGELVELSLGSYWRSGQPGPRAQAASTRDLGRRASGFLELNSPILFLKSSYVVGLDTSRGVERWDLRFDYDQFRWVDSLALGLVQYHYSDQHTALALDVTRLGWPRFRFLSASLRMSDAGFAWAQGGLDLILLSREDFNLTRRGHFATSLGLQAIYSYVSPDGASLIGRPGDEGQHGFKARVTAQVPAKWVMVALATLGAGMTGKPEDQQLAAELAAEVAREPRDIMFCRLEFEYTYNSPETFLFPAPDIVDRHRMFFSLGLVY
jgi:hypothetical protein